MRKTAFYILRIGMGISFILISLLILKGPSIWGAYLAGWARDLIPFSIEATMTLVGIIDLIIGILFVFDILTWIAALVASIHIIIILITTGIDGIIVRDIGMLAGTLSIFAASVPDKLFVKLGALKTTKDARVY